MPVLPGDPPLSQNQAPAQLAWQNRPTKMPQFTGTGDIPVPPAPATPPVDGELGDVGPGRGPRPPKPHTGPNVTVPRPHAPAKPTTQLGSMSADDPDPPSDPSRTYRAANPSMSGPLGSEPQTQPTAPQPGLGNISSRTELMRARMAQSRQPQVQPLAPGGGMGFGPQVQPPAPTAPRGQAFHTDPMAPTPFGSNPPVPPQQPGQTPGNPQFARGGRVNGRNC